MGFQASIIAIGAILVQFALNRLGAQAVAAFSAAQKIDMAATLPIMSFGITMATYAAQNYGARNPDRIRKGVLQCSLMSIGFSLAVAAANIAWRPGLIRLFVGDGEKEVVSLAQTYLNINASMYWVLALLFVFRYTLQGLGQSVVPTFAGVMELCMRALAAVILARYLGFAGVSMASPAAWIGSCVPLAIAYYFTRWKLSRTGKQVFPAREEQPEPGRQAA